AVQAGDIEKIATVPGVGKKSAGRIALELKDKVLRLPSATVKAADTSTTRNEIQEDALSALINLGYRPAEVKDVLKRVSREGQEVLALKDMIREVLKE